MAKAKSTKSVKVPSKAAAPKTPEAAATPPQAPPVPVAVPEAVPVPGTPFSLGEKRVFVPKSPRAGKAKTWTPPAAIPVLHVYTDGSGFGIPAEDGTVEMVDLVRSDSQYGTFYELLSIYGQTVEEDGKTVPAYRTAEQLFRATWDDELPDVTEDMKTPVKSRTAEQVGRIDLRTKLCKRVFQACFNLRQKGLANKDAGTAVLVSRRDRFWIHPETALVPVNRDPAPDSAAV